MSVRGLCLSLMALFSQERLENGHLKLIRNVKVWELLKEQTSKTGPIKRHCEDRIEMAKMKRVLPVTSHTEI